MCIFPVTSQTVLARNTHFFVINNYYLFFSKYDNRYGHDLKYEKNINQIKWRTGKITQYIISATLAREILIYYFITWQRVLQAERSANKDDEYWREKEQERERGRGEKRFTCVPSVHLRHVLLG